MPRLSFITPLHNKGAYIAETIESARKQTLSDWEMLIVENGSRDGGPATALQAAQDDPRIRLIQANVSGPGAARNIGIREAAGDWLLFLDADDLMQPEHCETLLRKAGDGKSVDIVVGGWRKFTSSPSELQPAERPSCEGRTYAQLLDSVIAFAPWSVHAVIVRRALLTEELQWPEKLDRFLGEDIAFWFKVLSSTPKYECSEGNGALYRWKTADCRTRDEDPVKWFEGLHHAACANLEWLKEHEQEPTPGQCESLMRLYEGLFQLALKHHNAEIADEARSLCRHWLDLAWRYGRNTNGLLARRVLGLRIFSWFRKCAPFRN